MGTFHTIYCSTRYKSLKNACKSEKDCNFIDRKGVVYKKCYQPYRFAGKIKEFVLSKVLDENNYGDDYNGYGWTNHYYSYYIRPHDAKTLLAMVEERKTQIKETEEPDYTEERLESPEWKALIKEIEEHNSMYTPIPTIAKNDFEQRKIQTPAWTQEQINDLRDKIANASNHDELWECWIELCKLNASTHKGYRALSMEQFEYNRFAYHYKEIIISEITEKWIAVGGVLQQYEGVLYVTNKDGWQVSFHRAPIDALQRAEKVQNCIWSNVICSWSYSDAKEYTQAAITWKQKQAKVDASKEAYELYLNRSLGIKNKVLHLLLEDKKIRRFYVKKGYYRAILEEEEICSNKWMLTEEVDYIITRFVKRQVA